MASVNRPVAIDASMSVLDHVASVLGAAGQPLRVDEITRRVMAGGQWSTKGKTPAATIEAQLATDIKKHGDASRFIRTAARTYDVREWPKQPLVTAAPPETMSFTDAAEAILLGSREHAPVNYRELTDTALERGLISTKGLTPRQTMYAQLITEIARRARRGDEQRFVRYLDGIFGLSRWVKPGLEGLIAKHNREVRGQLHDQLRSMDPTDFEGLIGELLAALGFSDVIVTKRTGDGGIDVRGVLVVADVIRTEMAVQVKRLRANVQAAVVRDVRGSLGVHDRGLIVTTSSFSSGARAEAARVNAAPVSLMDGDELVALLVEHEIGVRRSPQELLALEWP